MQLLPASGILKDGNLRCTVAEDKNKKLSENPKTSKRNAAIF